MSRHPLLPVKLLSALTADRQEMMLPFEVHLPATGRMVVHHGSIAFVGVIETDTGPRISLLAGMAGCNCGCGAAGRGIHYTPSPENARTLAAQLIEQAEELEARALADATAAIAKAAGK
jgi:hypothetical protein